MSFIVLPMEIRAKPRHNAYDTIWYLDEDECITNYIIRKHAIFIRRDDTEGEVDWFYGSYKDLTSYNNATKSIRKSVLEELWKTIDISEEVASIVRTKKKSPETRQHILITEEVASFEDKMTDATTSSSMVSSISVLESYNAPLPLSQMLQIKMICGGGGGILDFIIASYEGKLAFTEEEDEVEGYIYDEQSGMWCGGSKFVMKNRVMKDTLSALKRYKKYLSSYNIEEDSDNLGYTYSKEDDVRYTITKYLGRLPKQKKTIRSVIHNTAIWEEVVKVFYIPSFKDRFKTPNTRWAPLNDGHCINLETQSIRKIECDDYFTRYVDANSSGKAANAYCRKFFTDILEKKDVSALTQDMNKILGINPLPPTADPAPRPHHTVTFFAECLVKVASIKNTTVFLKDLYRHYMTYCLENGYTRIGKKNFGVEVVKNGYDKERRGNAIVVLDVKFSRKYTTKQ